MQVYLYLDLWQLVVNYLDWADPTDHEIVYCLSHSHCVFQQQWKKHTHFTIETDEHYKSLLRIIYRCNGKIHRDDDQPAVIYAMGIINGELVSRTEEYWYQNGRKHRETKDPMTGLVLYAWRKYEQRRWFRHGKLHRQCIDPISGLVLAAIEEFGSNGVAWYKDGKRHRTCVDPKTGLCLPAVVNHYGCSQEWWKEGIPMPHLGICVQLSPENSL